MKIGKIEIVQHKFVYRGETIFLQIGDRSVAGKIPYLSYTQTFPAEINQCQELDSFKIWTIDHLSYEHEYFYFPELDCWFECIDPENNEEGYEFRMGICLKDLKILNKAIEPKLYKRTDPSMCIQDELFLLPEPVFNSMGLVKDSVLGCYYDPSDPPKNDLNFVHWYPVNPKTTIEEQ